MVCPTGTPANIKLKFKRFQAIKKIIEKVKFEINKGK
jgi:hypothetical protein